MTAKQAAIDALLAEFEQELDVLSPDVVGSYAQRAQRIQARHEGYWVVSFSRHGRWIQKQRRQS
jgi:hypothetical protein